MRTVFRQRALTSGVALFFQCERPFRKYFGLISTASQILMNENGHSRSFSKQSRAASPILIRMHPNIRRMLALFCELDHATGGASAATSGGSSSISIPSSRLQHSGRKRTLPSRSRHPLSMEQSTANQFSTPIRGWGRQICMPNDSRRDKIA